LLSSVLFGCVVVLGGFFLVVVVFWVFIYFIGFCADFFVIYENLVPFSGNLVPFSGNLVSELDNLVVFGKGFRFEGIGMVRVFIVFLILLVLWD
jgi:hypothetical protein